MEPPWTTLIITFYRFTIWYCSGKLPWMYCYEKYLTNIWQLKVIVIALSCSLAPDISFPVCISIIQTIVPVCCRALVYECMLAGISHLLFLLVNNCNNSWWYFLHRVRIVCDSHFHFGLQESKSPVRCWPEDSWSVTYYFCLVNSSSPIF